LLQCFGQIVLGAEVVWGDATFDLEPLKRSFRPLPDSEEMAGIRVKSLQLRYPARHASRVLALRTLAGDYADAIPRMLDAHGGGPAIFETLRVSHAELEVTLKGTSGNTRHLIQLWPDRSTLPPTPLGTRLRNYLRHWGILHGDP
jgi:hypothetical protein